MLNNAILLALVCGVVALLYGGVTASWILKQPDGNPRMREIAAAIQTGAKAYLNRQYTTILMVGVVLFIALGLAIGWVAQLILGMGGKLSGITLFAGLAGSFVGGLVISLLSGDGLNIRASGILGSLLGAIIVLAIYGAVRKRGATA